MKKFSSFFLPGLCVAGLLVGIAARRMASAPAGAVSPPPSARASAVETAGTISNATPTRETTRAAKTTPQTIPHVTSTDTVESLLALRDGMLYPRLAAWLIDVGEEDIAAFWTSYQQRKRYHNISGLVFINWTRINPRAAVAAVAGTDDEHFAWRAWASHDPQASLTAAIAAGEVQIENVAMGIGEHNPEWLRAHLDQIPGAAKRFALTGMSKFADDQNPLETLNFLKENGRGFEPKSFKALARKDPWAALDWLKENPNLRSYNGTLPMDLLVETMSTELPEDLERLAKQTPSGELKRKMEAALFDTLLAGDPAAALEQAKTTDAPLIAAERLAKIGLSLARSDPERAFEIAGDIFTANDGKLSNQSKIELPDGSGSWGSADTEAEELMSVLLAKDPARVMKLAASPAQGKAGASESFYKFAGQWAERDIAGYATWVNTQTDPAIRDPAVTRVVYQLTQQGQFNEAADWAISAQNPGSGELQSLLSNWQRSDPEMASEWLESANLPDAKKVKLRSYLKANP